MSIRQACAWIAAAFLIAGCGHDRSAAVDQDSWRALLAYDGANLHALEIERFPAAALSAAGFSEPQRVYLVARVRTASGSPRVLIVQVNKLDSIGGAASAVVHVMDDVGQELAVVPVATGWRADIAGLTKSIHNGADLLVIRTHPVIHGPPTYEQFYALRDDNTLALVRMEDISGRPVRNNYAQEHFTVGPRMPQRSAADWARMLTGNWADKMESLLWLGGIGREDDKSEPPVQQVARQGVWQDALARKNLEALSHDDDAWISEAANEALAAMADHDQAQRDKACGLQLFLSTPTRMLEPGRQRLTLNVGFRNIGKAPVPASMWQGFYEYWMTKPNGNRVLLARPGIGDRPSGDGSMVSSGMTLGATHWLDVEMTDPGQYTLEARGKFDAVPELDQRLAGKPLRSPALQLTVAQPGRAAPAAVPAQTTLPPQTLEGAVLCRLFREDGRLMLEISNVSDKVQTFVLCSASVEMRLSGSGLQYLTPPPRRAGAGLELLMDGGSSVIVPIEHAAQTQMWVGHDAYVPVARKQTLRLKSPLRMPIFPGDKLLPNLTVQMQATLLSPPMSFRSTDRPRPLNVGESWTGKARSNVVEFVTDGR